MKQLLLIISIFFVSFTNPRSLVDRMPGSHIQSITLLGSIQSQLAEHLYGLPILYKGGEYEVNKKGDFELYDHEKPKELFLIITEYLKLPNENNIEHLKTSEQHPYLYFKLTKHAQEFTDVSKIDLLKSRQLIDYTETWNIEKLDNTEKSIKIPDNTVIIFLDPALVDRLADVTWSGLSNSLKLPTIVLNPSIDSKMLADLAIRMKLASLDFKFMHKKPYKAYMPCASNHILSMPFRPHAYC